MPILANAEMGRVNSELRTIQRQLAKKNAELEQSIAERSRTEAALRESKARLLFTLDATLVGQWDLDLMTDNVHRTLRHNQIVG